MCAFCVCVLYDSSTAHPRAKDEKNDVLIVHFDKQVILLCLLVRLLVRDYLEGWGLLRSSYTTPRLIGDSQKLSARLLPL